MQNQQLDKVDIAACFCASPQGTEEILRAYRDFLDSVSHIKLMHTKADISPKVFSNPQ